MPVTEITDHVDSVMFCLSKGLGAPVGSILAGDADFVERARRIRKLLGGGMRQVGVVAGPGLDALENVSDLAVDHDRAGRLAAGLDDVSGFDVSEPETNIVFADVSGTGLDVAAVLDRMEAEGVRASPFGPTTIRFCTHRDLTDAAVDAVPDRVATALE